MLGGCFLCVALNDVVVLLYLQRMGFLLFWVRFFFFFFAFFPPQFFAEKGKDRIKKNKNGTKLSFSCGGCVLWLALDPKPSRGNKQP